MYLVILFAHLATFYDALLFLLQIFYKIILCFFIKWKSETQSVVKYCVDVFYV